MSASATDFINLDAFAKALAEQLRESLPSGVVLKRVSNLNEAADYCGLTRDSFNKEGRPRSVAQSSPRQMLAVRQGRPGRMDREP